MGEGDSIYKIPICKLWKEEGKDYCTGFLMVDGRKVRVIMFRNERRREGKNDSHYDILIRKPLDATEDVKYETNDDEPF